MYSVHRQLIRVPDNAEALGTSRKFRNDDIQKQTELDDNQFQDMIHLARSLASKFLNCNLTYPEQTENSRTKFADRACKALPFLLEYKNGWPIMIYVTRYLFSKARKQGRAIPTLRPPIGTKQEFICQPADIEQLRDHTKTTKEQFRQATHFNRKEFNGMEVLLERLAKEYFDLSLLYVDQDRNQQRLVKYKALEEQPLFETRYEGAWPVIVCLSRYLRGTVHESSNRGAVEEPTGSRHTTQGRSSAQRRLRCPIPSISTRYSRTRASVDPRSASPHRPPNNPHTTNESRPVGDFLRSLQPSMEQYLPLFIGLGIRDEVTLSSFRMWSQIDQERFLADEVNKFQSHSIQRALRNAL